MEPKQKARLVLGVIRCVIGVPLACYIKILYVLRMGGYPHFAVMVTILGSVAFIAGLMLIVFSLASSEGKKQG